MFVPVFEKDKNKLFICTEEFIGKTKEEAMSIGWGASLVECTLLEMNFINETKDIDPKNTPHRKAAIGNMPVAIISGPLFEQVFSQHSEYIWLTEE